MAITAVLWFSVGVWTTIAVYLAGKLYVRLFEDPRCDAPWCFRRPYYELHNIEQVGGVQVTTVKERRCHRHKDQEAWG